MKFKLILTKSDQTKRTLLLLPTDMSSLQSPIEMKREKKYEEVNNSIQLNNFSKKRSEIKEHFDPKYEKIMKEESNPPIISSSDGRSFKGRYLDNSSNNYYVFINTGKAFKVIPIKKWYKFSQKINYDILSLDEAEAILKEKNNLDEDKKWMMHNRKVDEEIDYDEVFDDDNSDEVCYEEEEQVELCTSGKEINKILKGSVSEQFNTKSTEKKVQSETVNNEKVNNILTELDLLKMLKDNEVTIKELTTMIKKKFKINEETKKTLQKFIKEKCDYKKEISNGESVRKLKLKK